MGGLRRLLSVYHSTKTNPKNNILTFDIEVSEVDDVIRKRLYSRETIRQHTKILEALYTSRGKGPLNDGLNKSKVI